MSAQQVTCLFIGEIGIKSNPLMMVEWHKSRLKWLNIKMLGWATSYFYQFTVRAARFTTHTTHYTQITAHKMMKTARCTL